MRLTKPDRGFWGIGIYHTKCPANIGTLWRTANILVASFIFTINKRYKHQCSDTMKTPRHIPLYYYDTCEDLVTHLPFGCKLVGIEIQENAVDLFKYQHPKKACYLLGAEDYGLPEKVVSLCHDIVKLKGDYCLNVSVAGSIVAYHRNEQNMR